MQLVSKTFLIAYIFLVSLARRWWGGSQPAFIMLLGNDLSFCVDGQFWGNKLCLAMEKSGYLFSQFYRSLASSDKGGKNICDKSV